MPHNVDVERVFPAKMTTQKPTNGLRRRHQDGQILCPASMSTKAVRRPPSRFGALAEISVYRDQTQFPRLAKSTQAEYSLTVGRTPMPPGNWLCLGLFQPTIGSQIGFRHSRSALTAQNTESIFSKPTEPNRGARTRACWPGAIHRTGLIRGQGGPFVDTPWSGDSSRRLSSGTKYVGELMKRTIKPDTPNPPFQKK
jgi:hypothetical protein